MRQRVDDFFDIVVPIFLIALMVMVTTLFGVILYALITGGIS